MKDKLLQELTNKFIDNELTEEESAVLDNLLKDDKNKQYFESLTGVVNKISLGKQIDEEIEIKNIVMRKIMADEKKTLKEKIKNYINELLSGSLSSYAATFGFGGFFVLLIFMLIPRNNNLNDSFLQGVMGNKSSDESYLFNEKSIEGEIKVQYPEGIIVLDIDMTSNSVIDCELNFNKDDLSVYGIKSVKQQGTKTFYLSGSKIKLNDINSNHYMVFFKRVKHNYGKIDANFYMGNELINSKSIEIKQ